MPRVLQDIQVPILKPQSVRPRETFCIETHTHETNKQTNIKKKQK